MTKRVRWVVAMLVALTIVAFDRGNVVAQTLADVSPGAGSPQEDVGPRQYKGPPLSLQEAVDAAVATNPELVALRAQLPVVRERPIQERTLMPPTLEAQIWQWPLNSLNPASTNMYMFMFTQDIPGRGKRQLRATVAEKDVALAESDVAVRARDIIDQRSRAARFGRGSDPRKDSPRSATPSSWTGPLSGVTSSVGC